MSFEVKNLSHSYQLQNQPLPVLQNISFKIEAEKICSFLGPSGSGKSTLLKILAGLEEATTGELLGFNGLRKSFVFQDHQLLPWLSIEENIKFPLQFSDQKDESEKLFQMVGLKRFASAYPAQLSGGMKMRVSIARALINNPQLVFFDEPFSALDELTREQLQLDSRQILKSQKISCFFVTHSIAEALFMSDEIYILNKDGKVVHSEKNKFPESRASDLRFQSEFQQEILRLQKQFKEVLS